MEGGTRADHLSGKEAPVERWIIGGGERKPVPSVDQLGEQNRKRLTSIALPQA